MLIVLRLCCSLDPTDPLLAWSAAPFPSFSHSSRFAMRRTLPLFFTVCLLALVAAPAAQAQYNAGDDFEVVWTLDPRENTDQFPRGPAFGARSVLAGMDFDDDGLGEILFTTDETLAPGGPDPGFLDVFLYEATGTDNEYAYVWSYTMPEGSNSLPALAYGDIDEDGLWEIYFGVPTIANDDNTITDDLFVFEQGDDGTFPDAPTTAWGYDKDPADDFRPSGFVLDDVDADGQIELITTSRTSNARAVVVATPIGGLNDFTTWTTEFEAGEALLGGGGIYDVDVTDFDGDGAKEIWVNTWDNLSMTVFEATGADTYTLQVDINEANDVNDPGSFNSHALMFGDPDGDGSQELWLPMTDGKLYVVDDLNDVANLSAESFLSVGTYNPEATARGATIGDIDGDGDPDIFASHGTAEQISRIEYTGGPLADSTSYEWTIVLDSGSDSDEDPTDRYYPMAIPDMDLDGDDQPELVLTNLFASNEGQPVILVLEYTGGSVTSVDGITEVPNRATLRQNYPNPFNPVTTITYDLPATAEVTLTVYDVLGKTVRTIVPGQVQAAGEHNATWDATDDAGQRVASGVYLYVLDTGDSRMTRRMTLLK